MSQDKNKTPPLEISTQLFVRELFQGDQLVFPVSEPSLVSYGSAIESVEEQNLFLREYLLTASPDTIARFSLPEGTALQEFEVELTPSHLPEKAQLETPIIIPCLLIPGHLKRDQWVVVLPLAHTFYVSGGDDLEEAVRTEVKRMLAVQEDYSAWSFLQLFPAKKNELVPLTFSVRRNDIEEVKKAANKQKSVVEKKKLKEAFEILASVGNPLHLEDKPFNPFLSRDNEIQSLKALISGEERLGILLVGPELCGKSAVFEAWLQEEKKKPKPRPVFSTSGAQLIAGMSGLGQWQARLRRVMEAAELLDAVLYFDNLGDLLAERSSGGIDIPGAMKPYLEDNKVRIVGELTNETLDLLESRHMGFFSCLNRLRIDPLDAKKTKSILEARAANDRQLEPERPQILQEAIDPMLDLAERYLPYRAFPGKAVRLYDELRLLGERYTDGSGKVTIDRNRVYSAFSLKTGIPEKLLREDHALAVSEVLEFFHKKLIGQDDAQRRVAEVVCVVKAGLQPTGKPLATFLFVGPTGVGKTELARTLAAFLFGSEERMLRFDMSEYMDEEAAERLIRGTERSEGLLTRKIRQEPFCVLLLDEIEKANHAVFDLLLQVCGEGRLTDARGKTAYFHNSIIIMTSNLGAAQKKPASGFGQSTTVDDEAFYQKQVNKSFRPEFVNRLDRIITFQSLNQEEIRKVSRLLVNKVSNRGGLAEKGVQLKVTDSALDQIAIEGYSEKYGARALRRHIEDHVVAPCAQMLSRTDPELRGAQLFIALPEEPSEIKGDPLTSIDTKNLRFALSRPTSTKSSKEKRGFESISAARREIDRYMNIERVVQVKEQLDYLISQMTYGNYQKNKDQRLTQDISSLQNEYYRLDVIWKKAAEMKAELEAIEEIGLLALFGSEEIEPFVQEAKTVKTNICRQLVYLLLCLEPKRDQITLLVQELDDNRALDHWLAPMLESAEERKWDVEFHYDGGSPLPGETWPAARRWGPPRAGADLLKHIQTEGSRHKSFLIRVNGPFAGVFLALECGLHRYLIHGDKEAHMFCHNIALRTGLSDEEWLLEAIHPEAPPAAEELRPVAAVRELGLKQQELSILKKMKLEISDGQDYWDRFLDVLLAHLMLYEEDLAKDRDDVFQGRLEKRLAQLALQSNLKKNVK
jgi:ATP-dependent Clp protease ATP-binding subunit ClpC